MKRSPKMQRLEEILRASKLVDGGFLGHDARPLEEIIEADAADLASAGKTAAEVGARMAEITALARAGLGTFVEINDRLEACTDDSRGQIVCPFPGHERPFKTVTTLRDRRTGRTIRWSDLSAHMIGTHGFFEGKGSVFRLDPKELVEMIF